MTGPDGAVDVEVTASDEDCLAEVGAQIAVARGVPGERLWSGSAPLPDGLRLSAPELAHGAVLGWGRPALDPGRARPASALELHVTGGPEAGRALPLGQGRHVLGRGSDASIRLDDPDVSRSHVGVDVGLGGIAVADLGSTNGSSLDGQELSSAPCSWPVGATLRLGASALRITGPADGPTAHCSGVPVGRLMVRPIPRAPLPVPRSRSPSPVPPIPTPLDASPGSRSRLPAVGGVLMAVVLHTPTFLFFALLSPLVALATWLSDRWSGRRTRRSEQAKHAVAVSEATARLDAAVAEAVRAAEVAAPDLAAITSAVRRRSRLVWNRPRDAADALTVRLGTGPGDTSVVRLDGDGSRSPVPAPHLPVTVDLRTGGLSVVGPRERTVGVLSAVLVQLTALHAPGDLDLLLFLDSARLRDWSWSRWLPHVAPGTAFAGHGTGPSGVGPDDEALAARLTALDPAAPRCAVRRGCRRRSAGMGRSRGRPPARRTARRNAEGGAGLRGTRAPVRGDPRGTAGHVRHDAATGRRDG